MVKRIKSATLNLRINPELKRVAEKAEFSRAGVVRSQIAATGEDYDDLLFSLR